VMSAYTRSTAAIAPEPPPGTEILATSGACTGSWVSDWTASMTVSRPQGGQRPGDARPARSAGDHRRLRAGRNWGEASSTSGWPNPGRAHHAAAFTGSERGPSTACIPPARQGIASTAPCAQDEAGTLPLAEDSVISRLGAKRRESLPHRGGSAGVRRPSSSRCARVWRSALERAGCTEGELAPRPPSPSSPWGRPAARHRSPSLDLGRRT
jgi:hypothetical protein